MAFRNRRTLAQGLQREMGCSITRGEAFIQQLLAVITEGLIQDGVVKLSGFATFQIKPQRARQGRNPRTGEAKLITARRVISCRPSKSTSFLSTLKESKQPESDHCDVMR